MGTCSSSEQPKAFPNLYKQYSPQLIQTHVIAISQLEYLQKRKKYIMEEAKESVNELMASVFSPIQEYEEAVKNFYNEELRLATQLIQDENILNRLKMKIQGELIQISQYFTEIKKDLSKNVQSLQLQIYEYINQKFQKIQKDTKDKTIRIKYTDKIRKEQVDQILQRVKIQYKAKLKYYQTEIDNKFRQLFNQENYLKIYSKVKLNFDPFYKKFEAILYIVQNGQRNWSDQSKKGKLKLVLTQSDQINFVNYIVVKQCQSQIKQQNTIKQLIVDIKQAFAVAKQRLYQISNKIIKLQEDWKEQKRSLIKSKKKQEQSILKK